MNMETRFTKGPWFAHAVGSESLAHIVSASDSRTQPAGGARHDICNVIGGLAARTRDEVAANARLIAAAPDLYEVLNDCPLPSQSAPTGEFYERFYAWYEGARKQALSKAVKP